MTLKRQKCIENKQNLCNFPFFLISFSLISIFPSFLGSGPGRGRSPVEWGDFPSVHPFIRPAIHQRGLTACQRGLKNSWRGLRAIQRTEGKLEGSEDQPKGSDDQPRESDDQSEGSEGQSEGRGPLGGVWEPIGGV